MTRSLLNGKTRYRGPCSLQFCIIGLLTFKRLDKNPKWYQTGGANTKYRLNYETTTICRPVYTLV